MTSATGIGSMPPPGALGPRPAEPAERAGPPGEGVPLGASHDAAYHETVRVVLGLLGDHERGLPHLPELPARGVHAGMVGRGLAVVDALGADLQPAGWRLTDAPGVDQRRARSLLSQDLDAVEEQGQALGGAFKVQAAGPWTLAASVERPRGDKVLADHGARRDLAQALAEGLAAHVADVRRRLPGIERLVVQVDEPAMAAVGEGRVPTASGYGRHRTIDRPELSDTLGWVLAAVRDAGAEPWVHACAAGTPWDLVRAAGAAGLAMDADVLTAADLDEAATALEEGCRVALGVLPGTDPDRVPGADQVTERVLRMLEMLGLDGGEVGDRLVVTPGCGLAGASADWARRALQLALTVADDLG